MSSNQPKILKKDDSQRVKSRTQQPVQPKILTKSSVTKEVQQQLEPANVKPSGKDQDVNAEALPMKTPRRLLHSHFQLDQRVLSDHLIQDNTDFLVVGQFGLRNVGKTTLLNIIANPKYVNCKKESDISFNSEHQTFPATPTSEGNTLDMFITTDRLILLDASPLMCNIQRRDFIMSECDDLKLMLMMLQLCHAIIVVHDGFPDNSLMRLLTIANQMIPTDVKHRPKMIYVANKTQPGARNELPPEVIAKILKGVHLKVPDILDPGINLHYDIEQTLQELCENIYMMKRFAMDSDEEPFTEKKWSQRVSTVLAQMKGDYFLRKYEGLREKFHQHVEGM